MIDFLKLKNFKCFQTSSSFEFSGINLLTGINGRGKSSVLQAILLVSQSVPKSTLSILNGTSISFNGKHVSLGNFDDVRNSDMPKGEDIEIELGVDKVFIGYYRLTENEDDELTAISNLSIHINENVDEAEMLNKAGNLTNEWIANIGKELGELTDGASIPQFSFKNATFNQIISQVHYVCADRLGPVKYVDKVSIEKNDFVSVGAKGEFTLNVLAQLKSSLVNEKLCLGQDAMSVIQQTQEWLSYILDGAKLEIRGIEKESSVLWMLLSNTSSAYRYKPTNVGFGYSYILPLIVSGLIAQPGEILIIENPEAHLHPRAQSRISEFFARVASCGVQIFIESHSEHILNGLRVSVLNPSIEINNSDLSIYYFNESFEAKKLSVDNKGKIDDWPEGFFDQQELDLANIFKYSR